MFKTLVLMFKYCFKNIIYLAHWVFGAPKASAFTVVLANIYF